MGSVKCKALKQFDLRETLTKGVLATNPSYARNPKKPMAPRIRGTSTWAEDQGKTAPPQVRAMATEHVLAVTRKIPL